jgi:hypothetical protein
MEQAPRSPEALVCSFEPLAAPGFAAADFQQSVLAAPTPPVQSLLEEYWSNAQRREMADAWRFVCGKVNGDIEVDELYGA